MNEAVVSTWPPLRKDAPDVHEAGFCIYHRVEDLRREIQFRRAVGILLWELHQELEGTTLVKALPEEKDAVPG
eukprot:CAMPEP_0206446282 /NCGR_PEP_ID=MMETSP0324_2-20121206/16040_1 /ASSEMBLY_ACC=CAM_ASM_000836 /TAXON_ID=2866 /ORGANISM="Crypthecodinium cohnii, Strain Seligo" /LENGTH=72 /DNA_ID=CAMNT_0053914717 /DNA_START=661 /DNA_END=878 /DNA_ORIENTATION=+